VKRFPDLESTSRVAIGLPYPTPDRDAEVISVARVRSYFAAHHHAQLAEAW
jgi:hypothetical protein